MSKSPSLFARLQIPLFFLLAYLLSWWALPVVRGLLPHGVMFAAIIVIALAEGRSGLRVWWSRLTRVRAGWWYLAALAVIVGFILANAASHLLTGATFVGFPTIPLAAVAAELLIFGGQWEEPGWTGFALPALQQRFAKTRFGILLATVILGLLRGVWHLPLVLVGAIPWYDAVWFTPFVFQPFITWLYNKSGGSVPVVIVFHYLSNLLFAFSPTFTGGDRTMYTVVYLTGGGLATLVLAWRTRFEFGWRGAD